MKIIFFSPYSEIWNSSMPESLVAKELVISGHEVHTIRCNGLLSTYCPAMTSHGLNFESSERVKRRVCTSCIHAQKTLDYHSGVSTSLISDHISDEDRLRVGSILKSVNYNNWQKVEIESIPIGKFATYEILLNHKINEANGLKAVWEEYVNNLQQCLMIHFAISNFLKVNQVERLVVYNSLYSLNRTAVRTAEKFGVSWRTIHGGRNLVDMHQTLTISNDDSQDILVAKSRLWNAWSLVPLTQDEIRSVGQNIDVQFGARSAFTYSIAKSISNPQNLRNNLGISSKKKVILCTLASEDERFAADMVGALEFKMTENYNFFKGNQDWVLWLIDFVSKFEGFHLIIRLHPRGFPNKREGVSAASSAQIEEVLSVVPAQVTINRPSDNLSLYDLAEIVDVVVNSTSTAGLELLTLGIPVVSHCPKNLFSYPAEFNYVGLTKEKYAEAILEATKNGWSIENSIRGFRYRSFLYNQVSYSLHDQIPDRKKYLIHRILTWLRFRKSISVPSLIINFFREKEFRYQNKSLKFGSQIIEAVVGPNELDKAVISNQMRSPAEERRNIQRELSRIARQYFSGDDDSFLRKKIENNSL